MSEAIPSPNIWDHPDVYELENRGVDPDGVIDTAMREVRDWAGADVLDVGCGSGFHLPLFATTARRVVGVEPHPRLVRLARRRTRALPNVVVRPGSAQRLPLPDASVDVVHARWAYFFGPGCEPGLRELARVVRHGGDGVRRRQRRDPLDLRQVVPRVPPSVRPGRRRALLGPAGLDPAQPRHPVGVRHPGRLRGRRPDRVRAPAGGPGPRRASRHRGGLRGEPAPPELLTAGASDRRSRRAGHVPRERSSRGSRGAPSTADGIRSMFVP